MNPTVAVGVMSSLAIRYHGFESLSSNELARWYLKLVDEMLEGGFDVCLFTNGSPEDQRFVEILWETLAEHPLLSRIRLAAVQLPVDLCRVIFMSDVVVAFRMHALIAAYSYGKPFLALKWDVKVDAFLQAVGLEENIVDSGSTSPEKVREILVQLMRNGIDREKLNQVMHETRRSIDDLALTLQLP